MLKDFCRLDCCLADLAGKQAEQQQDDANHKGSYHDLLQVTNLMKNLQTSQTLLGGGVPSLHSTPLECEEFFAAQKMNLVANHKRSYIFGPLGSEPMDCLDSW